MSNKKSVRLLKPSLSNHELISFVLSKPFIVLISLIIPVYFLIYNFYTNGKFGFPLDDAFIHLTFAKNIFESGSYSYFKNEMITSGSTSPLYTLILSAEFLFLNNEYIICYITGISFFLFAAIYFLKLCRKIYPNSPYIIIISFLILVADKWVNFFAVSGMETTTFIFTLIAATYFYRTKRSFQLLFLLGVMIWIRPEGVIFIMAIVSDLVLRFISDKTNTISEIKKHIYNKRIIFGVCVFSIFLFFYLLMNLFLSGTIFPNTFYAKMTFYSPEFMSREYFLQNDVFDYFTSGSYLILIPGFILSFAIFIFASVKGKIPDNSLYIIFIFAFVFTYWLYMPYSGISGRYFAPLIPFFILISVSGYYEIYSFLKKFNFKIVVPFYFLLMIYAYYASSDLRQSVINYNDDCRSIDSLHIAAANWVHENTGADDVIATHEIGAIGFYSERKLVDIAGIVSKDLIQKLPDPDYIEYMQNYLSENEIKYIAVMKNWCKVVNQNPLCTFKSDQQSIEIYNYQPGHTHILNKGVNKLLYLAEYNIKKESYKNAIRFLKEAESLDSSCSLTYYLKASAYFKLNDIKNYEISLLKAIEIFPEYSKALLALCNLYRKEKDETKFNFYVSQYNSLAEQKPIPSFTNELNFYY